MLRVEQRRHRVQLQGCAGRAPARGHLGGGRPGHRGRPAAGDEDPRPGAAGLIERSVATLKAAGVAARPRVRGDVGYFANQIAWAAVGNGCDFSLGVTRNKAAWRAAAAISDDRWTPAIRMNGAQAAVADYVPAGWPPDTLHRHTAIGADHVAATCGSGSDRVGRGAVAAAAGVRGRQGVEHVGHLPTGQLAQPDPAQVRDQRQLDVLGIGAQRGRSDAGPVWSVSTATTGPPSTRPRRSHRSTDSVTRPGPRPRRDGSSSRRDAPAPAAPHGRDAQSKYQLPCPRSGNCGQAESRQRPVCGCRTSTPLEHPATAAHRRPPCTRSTYPRSAQVVLDDDTGADDRSSGDLIGSGMKPWYASGPMGA